MPAAVRVGRSFPPNSSPLRLLLPCEPLRSFPSNSYPLQLLLPCETLCSFLLSPIFSPLSLSFPILPVVRSFLPLMTSSLPRRRRRAPKRQVSNKSSNCHRNHHLSIVCHEQQPIPSAPAHPSMHPRNGNERNSHNHKRIKRLHSIQRAPHHLRASHIPPSLLLSWEQRRCLSRFLISECSARSLCGKQTKNSANRKKGKEK